MKNIAILAELCGTLHLKHCAKGRSDSNQSTMYWVSEVHLSINYLNKLQHKNKRTNVIFRAVSCTIPFIPRKERCNTTKGKSDTHVYLHPHTNRLAQTHKQPHPRTNANTLVPNSSSRSAKLLYQLGYRKLNTTVTKNTHTHSHTPFESL